MQPTLPANCFPCNLVSTFFTLTRCFAPSGATAFVVATNAAVINNLRIMFGRRGRSLAADVDCVGVEVLRMPEMRIVSVLVVMMKRLAAFAGVCAEMQNY